MNPKMFRPPDSALDWPVEDQDKIRQKMCEKAIEASIELAKKPYSYPKTADEWWDIVNKYWPDLIVVAAKYVDLERNMIDIDGNMSVNSLLENITIAKNSKDIKLSKFFSMVWCDAPDSRSLHSDWAWNIICDLCSESYVLYPDGPPEEYIE